MASDDQQWESIPIDDIQVGDYVWARVRADRYDREGCPEWVLVTAVTPPGVGRSRWVNGIYAFDHIGSVARRPI